MARNRSIQDIENRFWSRVRKGQEEECWPWMSYGTKGYGMMWIGGRHVYAHRFAYELANGPVPDGRHVLHTCDNPPCCNPKHLWLGTHRDNMADMYAKGRGGTKARGSAHGNAKLDEETVLKIFRDPRPCEKIGWVLGMSTTAIGDIKRGHTWSHVTGKMAKPVQRQRSPIKGHPAENCTPSQRRVFEELVDGRPFSCRPTWQHWDGLMTGGLVDEEVSPDWQRTYTPRAWAVEKLKEWRSK